MLILALLLSHVCHVPIAQNYYRKKKIKAKEKEKGREDNRRKF